MSSLLLIYDMCPDDVSIYYFDLMDAEILKRIEKLDNKYCNSIQCSEEEQNEHMWLLAQLDEWKGAKIETPSVFISPGASSLHIIKTGFLL